MGFPPPLASPVLPMRGLYDGYDGYDGDEDGDVAFPTSAHESRYDDEPDDVYADFGVIFGVGGGGGGEDSEEQEVGEDGEGAGSVGPAGVAEEEAAAAAVAVVVVTAAGAGVGGTGDYEGFMDEVDGIPWSARC